MPLLVDFDVRGNSLLKFLETTKEGKLTPRYCSLIFNNLSKISKFKFPIILKSKLEDINFSKLDSILQPQSSYTYRFRLNVMIHFLLPILTL